LLQEESTDHDGAEIKKRFEDLEAELKGGIKDDGEHRHRSDLHRQFDNFQ
jgi:hypothetical protein